MSKTNEGYIAEVPLAKADSINFCFRDTNNNWDNNETKKQGEDNSYQIRPAIKIIMKNI